MQAKLKAREIDVCIGESCFDLGSFACPDISNHLHCHALLRYPALTDALIAGIANGQTSYKLVGRYISTPLRW